MKIPGNWIESNVAATPPTAADHDTADDDIVGNEYYAVHNERRVEGECVSDDGFVVAVDVHTDCEIQEILPLTGALMVTTGTKLNVKRMEAGPVTENDPNFVPACDT
uniref:Uncharacterized protein n=1 Tax=Romanomermis culicivorax TaxID=13658 RepID=A0A915I633_ROMCU